MKQLTFRLCPGELLKEEIEKRTQQVPSGVLLSIVGGLENAVLRMAGSEPNNQFVKEWEGPFEIVGGTGTISKDGCHIHVALSDNQGEVLGGHLKDGCRIMYTAEVVIGIFNDVEYSRLLDENTGFRELVVKNGS